MIAVHRTSEPKILKNSGQKWLDDLLALRAQLEELSIDGNTTKQKVKKLKRKITNVQKKYSHRQIKSSLVEMFHGKCAYCESKITVVTYGHIEHFRPKGNPLYIHHTFEWNNLLLACDICNGRQHKGVKFPIDHDGEPLLIDPTIPETDISQHLNFIWDHHTKIAIVQGLDAKGRETIDVFDLNGLKGRKELVKARNNSIKKLIAIANFASQGNPGAIELLHEAYNLDEPYLGFVRKIIPTIYPIEE